MQTRLEGNPGAVAGLAEVGEVRLPEMRGRKHDLGEFREIEENVMKKLMFAAFLAVLLIGGGSSNAKAADSYIMIPTTPDLSISGLATAEFVIDSISGSVSWVHIRNDCDTALYFDLNGAVQVTKSVRSTQVYPLRLEGLGTGNATRDTQYFEGPFRLKTLGVSNDTNNTCTFSLIVGGQ